MEAPMFHHFPFGDVGHGRQHGRFFEKGEFKYLILELLKEKPSYGYEIIKALEDRFHGLYSPSPGVVYPTLQMLEEMGHVTAAERDGRKVYSITEAGLRFLDEQRETAEGIGERMSQWFGQGSHREWREALRDLRHSLRELHQLVMHEARTADAAKLRRSGQALARARQELEAILTEQPERR